MNRLFGLVFVSLAIALPLACAKPSGSPSAAAQEMPGATGTFPFQPSDWIEGERTWWVDSDGIAPGVAGCHIGTDQKGVPNGRMFGEACLPDGRLVESNPGMA